jgi:UDP-N-acetylmuramyl pentapeptide synthase
MENLFALDAIKKGATFAIVDNNELDHENIIYTKSVQSFIKKFVKFLLGAYKGKIVAISGSVGKNYYKRKYLSHIK